MLGQNEYGRYKGTVSAFGNPPTFGTRRHQAICFMVIPLRVNIEKYLRVHVHYHQYVHMNTVHESEKKRSKIQLGEKLPATYTSDILVHVHTRMEHLGLIVLEARLSLRFYKVPKVFISVSIRFQ